jgi:hypothetical protein
MLVVIACLALSGRESNRYVRNDVPSMRDVAVPLGKYLATYSTDIAASRRPTLVLEDAGAIPYYSDWNVIDFYSLNDVHLVCSRSFDADYVFSRKPDMVILRSKAPDSFIPPNERNGVLYEHCARNGMTCVRVFCVASDYYYWVLASPGGNVSQFIARWQPHAGVDVTPRELLAERRAARLSIMDSRRLPEAAGPSHEATTLENNVEPRMAAQRLERTESRAH